MKAKLLSKSLLITALASTLLAPVSQVIAAENLTFEKAVKEVNNEISANALTEALAEVKKESSVAEKISIKSTEELQFETYFKDVAFADAEKFVYAFSEPDKKSEWTGKLYNMCVADVILQEDDWYLVQSGDLIGYVKKDNFITGRDAIEAAKAYYAETYPEVDVFTLTEEEVFDGFQVGETKKAEKARLEAEEAARVAAEREAEEARIAAEKAAEEARIAAEKAEELRKGYELVDYATQFIGNPYVYGGTSLTNGTDCSGFVKSVYAQFGVYLPRTSYYMRGVGESVSYSDMQPGDIVCYSGHVALYMGDGRIVHALNERTGITISSVNYASIIDIRRVF